MHYIHSVPGRLRVRSPRLRGSTQTAARVQAELVGLAGVQSVSTNALLGSTLVCYDHARISLDEVWATLARLGCVQGPPVTGVAGADWADLASDAIAGAVVQKLAEASVMALVRALI